MVGAATAVIRVVAIAAAQQQEGGGGGRQEKPNHKGECKMQWAPAEGTTDSGLWVVRDELADEATLKPTADR